ncbi:MAG TPA: hypothetical protein VGH10_10015 [Actinomycetota bacterium]|jgi:hypothetical protein
MNREPDVRQQVDSVATELTLEFEGRVDDGTVRRVVMGAYSRLAQARITTYVPIFVRREARQSLRALAVHA